jgi:hypothetical protein
MKTRGILGRVLVVVVLVALAGGAALVLGQGPDNAPPQPAGVGAQSVTVTLTAVADAFIRNLTPSTSYGTSADLYVWYSSSVPNPDEIMYSLIRFDLAAAIPPEAIIEAATLRVYLYAIGNTTEMLPVGVSAHPITNPWAETGVTWYGQPPVGAAEVTAPISLPYPAWKAWPVTNMVRDWHANPAQNYGVELRGPRLGMGTSYYLFFRSRDSSPKPQLDVTYRLPSPYTRIYLPISMRALP